MRTSATLISLCFVGCTAPGGPPGDGAGGPGGKADDSRDEEGRPLPPDPDGTAGPLAFDDAYLQCFDGETEIGIYESPEAPWHEGGELLDMKPGHEIRVRTAGGERYSFAEGVVAFTDGAGNDTFQLLHVTPTGLQIPWHMHYDHEEGFLRGRWARPIYYEPVGSGAGGPPVLDDFGSVEHFDEAMNCYDYTFGDL